MIIPYSKITFVLLRSQLDKRSDIPHQCILSILDSPLNKSGLVTIFLHTTENILIYINGKTRIPRSLHRFNGLMDQLKKERKIKSEDGTFLMKIIKNPVSEYLPPNSIKIGLSQSGIKSEFDKNKEYVFYLNADQNGEDLFEDAEFLVKVSDFPLSAFVCCTKICSKIEDINEIF